MFTEHTQYTAGHTRRDEYLNDRDSILFTSAPTISLFVQTDDPLKKFLVVCHKDDTISKPPTVVLSFRKIVPLHLQHLLQNFLREPPWRCRWWGLLLWESDYWQDPSVIHDIQRVHPPLRSRMKISQKWRVESRRTLERQVHHQCQDRW